MWFWQYKVKVVNSNEGFFQTEVCCGLCTGDTIVDAVRKLYAFYGEDLIDILGCKAVVENVFEFATVDAEGGFDYTICPKENKKG